MTAATQPGLFGLKNSNRDFTSQDSWGKNQFNSSFPAALCCYLAHKNLNANYLKINSQKTYEVGEISISDAFGADPLSSNTHFSFEAIHAPFQPFVKGELPRTDLVIQTTPSGVCNRGLEVKLTALPDHTTCALADNAFSSEIVVRPDTVVYLACSIIKSIKKSDLKQYLTVKENDISDWSEPHLVLTKLPKILKNLKELAANFNDKQTPFLLQPVWKTEGKSPRLADNCLDVFIWSDAGFLWFINEIASTDNPTKISRHLRTNVWLYKMLLDYYDNGSFSHKEIIDKLSFNTKNDKAFSSAGNTTHKFLTCANLTKPRILKKEIKEIILGGGQNLLSPERRFDAIIFNSPELFK